MSAPAREVPDAVSGTEDALAGFFAGARPRLTTPDHRRLWAALGDAAADGKRFRPALFHSVYLALGGRDLPVAAQVAAAIELLHTALVVHDDVIDGDTVRRGRPNVAGTFAGRARAAGHRQDRARHYGSTAAILAGDLALAGAVRTLALCGAPPATVARLLDHLDRALHITAAGELTDVRLSMGEAADVAETRPARHRRRRGGQRRRLRAHRTRRRRPAADLPRLRAPHLRHRPAPVPLHELHLVARPRRR